MTNLVALARKKNRRGPKTARGKRHSSRNALRHGLSVPIDRNPENSAIIEEIARAIVGLSAAEHRLAVARTVARSFLELQRLFQVENEQVATKELASGKRVRRNVDRHLGSTPAARPLNRDSLDRYWARAHGRFRSSVRRLDIATINPNSDVFNDITSYIGTAVRHYGW